jgi:hypothetical protein
MHTQKHTHTHYRHTNIHTPLSRHTRTHYTYTARHTHTHPVEVLPVTYEEESVCLFSVDASLRATSYCCCFALLLYYCATAALPLLYCQRRSVGGLDFWGAIASSKLFF